MNKMFGTVFLNLALTSVALAGVKVTSVDLTTEGQNGYVNIAIDGRSTDLPDIKVYGKTIEISIPNSDGFAAIFKNVRGAQLSANSLNGKAIVKATMPYEIQASAVDLGWKNSNIEVIFPRGKVVKTTDTATNTIATVSAPAPKEPVARPIAPAGDRKAVPAPATNKISKDLLNEDYLNNLMKEEKTKTEEAKAPAVAEDVVSVKQAAQTKPAATTAAVPKASNSSDSFSFAGYVVKFTVFLAMVLGLFYGVVQLLKKGVFKKGKLGFLNNSQMIEVLSTTYVGPKRSLMIVKAHKQIFLVANSESGLTFLSEMTDTSGLVKEGEKLVTGTNFDMNLGSANLSEEETLIKLKEDIMQSTPINEEKGLAKIAVAKDIVKFSDELKKKAKKLKPIEFN